MKVGDLVKHKQGLPIGRLNGYGVIVDIHGGDMGKVIWQGLACNSSWEMLHNLVDAAHELMVFNSQHKRLKGKKDEYGTGTRRISRASFNNSRR